MPTTRMIQRDDPAGFTLLELLVALAVLGLVLGIVVTRGPMRSAALELRAASGELAGALRSARARAIVSDRTVLLMIDTAKHQYQTAGDPPRPLPWSVAITVTAPANLVAGNWLTGIRFSARWRFLRRHRGTGRWNPSRPAVSGLVDRTRKLGRRAECRRPRKLIVWAKPVPSCRWRGRQPE